MPSEKPFFNNLQGPYHRRKPTIYKVEKVKGLTYLEQNASIIKEELLENLADVQKAALCFRKHTLKKQLGWKQIELKIYGVEYPQRVALFPETMAILKKIPNVSTIYFSLLSPHTAIPAHVGDTDAFYRVHLALEVPKGLPECGFEVAGQQLEWREGKCLAFNDMYCHTAWNYSGRRRVVLVLDILRPEFLHQQIWINAGVRATLYHSRIYEKLFFVFELFPRVVTRALHPMFHWVSYAWHKFKYFNK